MTIEFLLTGQMTWKWPIIVIVFIVIAMYVRSIRIYTELSLRSLQPILFISSAVTLSIVVASPLAVLSHLSFSLHMIQMSILYFIIPPILLLGIPETFFVKLIEISRIKRLPTPQHPPIVVLSLFAILFLLYHLPFLLSVLVSIPVLQNTYLTLLFILSFGMWWPMVSSDPSTRLSKDEMKRYAMLSGYLLLPACLLFILTAFMDGGNNPLLTQLSVHLCLPPSLGSSDLLPSPFNTKYDQALSGFLMLGLHKASLLMIVKLEGVKNR
ncbi:cytochrome c oxidase assembly protein [Sporosarcina quadrami]|nr:cytochrome c oxidase assembly protein [Sporosarcina quadrami]